MYLNIYICALLSFLYNTNTQNIPWANITEANFRPALASIHIHKHSARSFTRVVFTWNPTLSFSARKRFRFAFHVSLQRRFSSSRPVFWGDLWGDRGRGRHVIKEEENMHELRACKQSSTRTRKVYAPIFVHTCIYTVAYCIHTHAHKFIHTYIYYMNTHTFIYMTWIHIHVYINTYKCACTWIHIYAYVLGCIQMHMYMDTYTCT